MKGNCYEAATAATAPVAGSSAGLYTFSTGKTAIFVKNTTGQTIYMRYNTTDAASATVFDEELANNGSLHVGERDRGVGCWDSIGIWVPATGNVANLVVRGAG